LDLEDIINRLRNEMGKSFERAVTDAFKFLGFDAEHINETQAESDIIIKAPQALKPYYVVAECEAVREGNQVSYRKLGQLHGNFGKYATRYKEYSSSYKMLVGKPVFSNDAIESSKNEPVTLLTSEMLIRLLEYNSRYILSQDELENFFLWSGLIQKEHIETICNMYMRKVKLYSLIYISLINRPTRSRLNIRGNFIPLEELIGSIKTLSYLMKIENVNNEEIFEAIRDLSNPFIKIVEIKKDTIKLSGLSYNVMVQNLRGYGIDFNDYVEKILSLLEKIRE